MRTGQALAMVLAGTALTACLHDTGLDPFDPIVLEPPDWVPVGVAVPAISADLGNGVSTNQVEVTFEADGSFTVDFAAPDTRTVTVGANELVSTGDVGGGTSFLFETASAESVELIVSGDVAAAITRLDLDPGVSAGYETYAVAGDETEAASLPTGEVSYYAGTMVASLFVGGDLPDVEYNTITGNAYVRIDLLDLHDVELELTDFTIGGTTLDRNLYSLFGFGGPVTGSQYEVAIDGDIAVGASVYTLSGTAKGAIFGAVGEDTAGTFSASDVGNGVEMVGAYTANETAPPPMP